MGSIASGHPTDQTLQAFGLGKLEKIRAEPVNRHLESCPECRRRVAELSSDSDLDRLGRGDPSPPAHSSLAGLSRIAKEPSSVEPPPASSLPPGLADHPDYEVIRELGQGGMGTVYLALNRLMGRREVLKMVSSHMINRRGVLDRFLGEIRNAARLQHPNIVTAYSALRIGDSIAFAMEYVEGLDLSKLVKTKGALPVAHACNFVHQAALGLQHAHEQGMVHRDIKPSNLMLSRQGARAAIKVLDFGLAKVKSEGAVDGGLTHEGQILGTPEYVAPEQTIDARKADIRADIYSLGCTMYYLLTGGPPFRATSLYELLQAHHSMDALPLNEARPEVPVELAAIVAKMMAKEPELRFQTPKEVAQALLPFFKKGQTAPRSSTPDLLRVEQAPLKPPRDAEDSTGSVSVVALKRFPRWVWPSIAASVLLLGIGVAWAAGVFGVSVTKVTSEAAGGQPIKPRLDVGHNQSTKVTSPVSPRTRAILNALEKPVEMSFANDTPLDDILKYIHQATKTGKNEPGIPIYVDPIGLSEAKETLSSTINVDVKGIPLTVTLRRVLDEVNLAYVVKDDVLIISSPGRIEKERKESPAFAGDSTKATKELMAKLEATIAMPFGNETALEDVLKHIKQATKGPDKSEIPILNDPKGFQEARQSLDSTVIIELEGVPLKTTLRLLLKQLGLAYIVKDGLVFISSIDRIKKELKP